MHYIYTAKDTKGETYSGEYEAESKLDLYAKIRKDGGQVQSVRERRPGSALMRKLFSRVDAEDKIFFAKNLSSMLKSGLSVTRALAVMEKQSKKPALKDLLYSISEDVSKGIALSQALSKRSKVFPQIFVSVVRAGEESGNLAESLGSVGLQAEKSHLLGKRVKGALIYPAVIISLMVIISILLLKYMVPTLTVTFDGLGVELPLSTRIIIAASDFLINHAILTFGSLAVLIFMIITFIKSARGRRIGDRIWIRLPVIGLIVKEVESARTARTLSSLITAGVPITDALEVTENVLGNHLYKKALSEARAAIQEGETISHVLSRHEDIYPPFISEMSAVGEETGKIGEMFENVASYYEEDVDEKTKDLSTIIEPLLMAVIGAGVGIFALSMLSPIYSLSGSI